MGLSCFQVAMGVRAGRLEPHSSEFIDKRGRSIGTCRLQGISDDLHGWGRLLALAVPALREVCLGVTHQPAPLFLALAEPGRPDDDERLGLPFVEALANRSGCGLDLDRCQVVRAGHAGVAFAAQAALELLAEDPCIDVVLVGAVDSYFHPGVLDWLDQECRLHALGAENGFIPSEGAGFFTLERLRIGAASRRSGPVVRYVATGHEQTVSDNAPNLAVAMTNLVRQSTEAAPEIGWVLSDLNGERHRVREWTMTEMRTLGGRDASHDQFVEQLGDVGAASGALLIAIAHGMWQAGCAPASTALIALHAEGTERGVFVMEEAARLPNRPRRGREA